MFVVLAFVGFSMEGKAEGNGAKRRSEPWECFGLGLLRVTMKVVCMKGVCIYVCVVYV